VLGHAEKGPMTIFSATSARRSKCTYRCRRILKDRWPFEPLVQQGSGEIGIPFANRFSCKSGSTPGPLPRCRTMINIQPISRCRPKPNLAIEQASRLVTAVLGLDPLDSITQVSYLRHLQLSKQATTENAMIFFTSSPGIPNGLGSEVV